MAGSVATQVYNGATNSNGLTVTNQFSKSSFLYFIAPDTTDDYEIDCFLQLELGSEVKRIPLETIALKTNNVITIPAEYRNCGLPQRLAMITDEVVTIEAYSVECFCCGQEELQEILNRLAIADFKDNLTLTNQLLQDYAISALAGSLGAALAPVTAGLSAAIPASVLPVLAPAQTYLPIAGVLTGFP